MCRKGSSAQQGKQGQLCYFRVGLSVGLKGEVSSPAVGGASAPHKSRKGATPTPQTPSHGCFPTAAPKEALPGSGGCPGVPPQPPGLSRQAEAVNS